MQHPSQQSPLSLQGSPRRLHCLAPALREPISASPSTPRALPASVLTAARRPLGAARDLATLSNLPASISVNSLLDRRRRCPTTHLGQPLWHPRARNVGYPPMQNVRFLGPLHIGRLAGSFWKQHPEQQSLPELHGRRFFLHAAAARFPNVASPTPLAAAPTTPFNAVRRLVERASTLMTSSKRDPSMSNHSLPYGSAPSFAKNHPEFAALIPIGFATSVIGTIRPPFGVLAPPQVPAD